MINKNIYILIGIVVIVGVFVVYNLNTTEAPSDTSKEVTKDGLSLTLSEDSGDIKQIPITDNVEKEPEINYPELTSSIVFPDSLSEEARVIIANNIATLIDKLENNKDSFSEWLNLAAQYKIIEDYERTRDILEFLDMAFTNSDTVLNNLGNLYHYDLKNYPKSEESFLKAVGNNADNVQAYIGLHELYKYSYKQDTDLAIDTLVEGIEANPRSTDLLITLASYYKERGNMSKGDQTNAKKYYEQARDEAEKLGNTQLVDTLNEEINNL